MCHCSVKEGNGSRKKGGIGRESVWMCGVTYDSEGVWKGCVSPHLTVRVMDMDIVLRDMKYRERTWRMDGWRIRGEGMGKLQRPVVEFQLYL